MFGKAFHKGFFWLLLILGWFLFPADSYAYSTFYLQPSKKIISVGGVIPVELRLNTDNEAVNAFSVYLSYPSEKIELSLASYSDLFSVVAEEEIENGTIRISKGSLDPVVGDVLIGTFLLKGKIAGTVPLEFMSGSAVARFSDSSDALSLSRSVGGFYTVEQPKAGTTKTTPRKSFLFRFFNW